MNDEIYGMGDEPPRVRSGDELQEELNGSVSMTDDIEHFIDAIKHSYKLTNYIRNLIICKFIWYVYAQDPLNGDDIEEITAALKEWNGDE
tara:strand:- start:774 stop:1043 length:270 start_codon:yes stop_codon:yes gene_type:complete